MPDGNLNRDYLAGLVFNNTLALQKLNAIVHPAVREDFKSWCTCHANYPYLIEEAAILIESGAYKDLDVIITVNVDREARIFRVMERDNYSREQVELRLKRQMSDVERAQHADYIIGNNENELVIPQVLKIHEDLIRKADSRS